MDIIPSHLYPRVDAPNGIQQLSISGYQHKLQVNIIDGIIKEYYGDFILKPYSDKYSQLPENEHLNVSFMREFGFEVPFNALIYDERKDIFHYLIKRFDIDENGNKLPQISLNALMGGGDKYKGTIEEISSFLCNKLDDTQKMLFLEYIYANALLYNNDLHKKNISFVFKNNQLVLSPVYDVINCYPIRNISNEQSSLPIKRHTNGIRINYFKQSSENLELNFSQVRENLMQIQDIYLEKYPQYVEKITQIPHFENILNFKEKLLESHKKCFKIAQRKAHSGMDNSEYLRLFVWRDLEKQHNIKSENLDDEKKLIIENKISSFYLKLNCLDKVKFVEKLDEFVNDLVQELKYQST